MDQKPSPKKGFVRIWFAFIYSLHGLRFAITKEAAFIQEICIYFVLLVVLFILPLSTVFKCVLFFANTLVLIVEILNSGIESIVDLVSPNYNDLAKRAKDLGSAAVLISIVLAIVLWVIAIYLISTNFYTES
jgi:diacylglycerol kinase (ATP)